MTSKALLSAVLGYPKSIPYDSGRKTYLLNLEGDPYINPTCKPTNIYFQTDGPGLGVNLINVYELAHKCKQWAKKTIGYEVTSSTTESWVNPQHNEFPDFYIKEANEPEAVFAACGWVLENKDT